MGSLGDEALPWPARNIAGHVRSGFMWLECSMWGLGTRWPRQARRGADTEVGGNRAGIKPSSHQPHLPLEHA
jgi:hypothetical protein